MIILVPLFLIIYQECWKFLCIMVQCATIHTICWWKWKFLCIMSRLLKIVTCDWSSTASEASSGSSSSSVSCLVTSQRVILWNLIVLHGIVMGLCQVILWLYVIVWLLHSIVLLLHSVVWSWGLIELWSFLSIHHFNLYPVCI
jgi:hypothetical protein